MSQQGISSVVNRRLLRSMLLFYCVIVVAITIFSAVWMHSQLIQNVNFAVTSIGHHVTAYIEDAGYSLANVAHKSKNYSSEDLKTLMADMLAVNPQFLRMAFLGFDGRILLSVPPGASNADFSLPMTPFPGSPLAVSHPFPSEATGRLVVYLGHFAHDRQRVIGELDLNQLREHLQSFKPYVEGSIILTDAFGTLISHEDDSAVARQENLGDLPPIRDSGSSPHTTLAHDAQGWNFVTSLRLPGAGWVVLAKTPIGVILGPLARFLAALLAILIGLLCLLNFRLRRVLARQVVEPLERFTQTIARVKSGDYAVVHGASSNLAELSQVETEFAAMAKAVQAREASIRDAANRFQALFTAVQDPILVAARDSGMIVECNSAAEHYFKISRQDFVGSHQDVLQPDRSLAACGLTNDSPSHISGQGLQRDVSLRDALGGCLTADINSASFELDGADYLLSVFHDVTERNKAHEALLRAMNEAEASSRAKSIFLANMSHEIRTPLNGIYGMLQLLQTVVRDAEHKQYIEIGLKATRRLTGLLSDILDLSRIESGRLSVSEKKFEVLTLEEAVLELFQIPAREKGLALSFTVNPAMPRVLVGDESRVRQILFNLVGNAIKFTEAGEVAVEVHPLSSILDQRFHVLFMVRDTGIGIADEQLRTIFDPFVQVEESCVRRYQGAGLGLSIVAKLVRLLGGGLTMDSEPGKGTTLYVSLPFAMPSALPAPDAKRHGDAPASGKVRVLVVDDDSTTSFVVMTHLEKSGHSVVVARNGRECLSKLQDEAFDLVLMDIQMPEMDGIQATRAIRFDSRHEAIRDIPIIALTAYAMSSDREKFLAAGMDDYIAKPVDMQHLMEVIERVLEKRR